jgi:hypothetical protein
MVYGILQQQTARLIIFFKEVASGMEKKRGSVGVTTIQTG